jgi:ABC-type Zn2+ transport system substrate-binding protein/surface adhesin
MLEPDTDSTALRAKIEAKLAALSPDERARIDASLEKFTAEIATVGEASARGPT